MTVKGIEIEGCQNTADQINLKDIRGNGILIGPDINSNNNTISNVTGSNVENGIVVRSGCNVLSNIKFENGDDGSFLTIRIGD